MASCEDVRQRGRAALATLRADYQPQDVIDACTLLTDLRNCRDYDLLLELADAISRIDPQEPTARRLYAQALIESGKITAAIDVLDVLKARLPANHDEAIEAAGLLGRAYKQIYFDARMRGTEAARRALSRAIDAYRAAYEANSANTWHGVNLLALIEHCRRLGIAFPESIKPRDLAQKLLDTLRQIPEDKRDGWYLATLAEVSLATGDWGIIESALLNYAQSPQVHAFHLASTLRQLTKIWHLQDEERGRAVIDVLTARLMQKPEAAVELPSNQINRAQPDGAHYQAMLGAQRGTRTKKWWETGLARANSVAAIRQKLAGRVGTGFLVRAKDFGLDEDAEFLVLTNFHVVNKDGLSNGIRPEDAEVVFEAVDPNRAYAVQEILWSSIPEECDASLLRLSDPITGVNPLTIAKVLPVLELGPPQPQVYIIGHPAGRELTYSFDNNEIIDHEGPEAGVPARPDLRLVHYNATTEGGSSGSPVFNSSWDVIALHHKGGKIGMPKLNGKSGSYAANEGIWLQSVIAQVKSKFRRDS